MVKDVKFYSGFLIALVSFLGLSVLLVVMAFILRILTFGFFKYKDLKVFFKALDEQENLTRSIRSQLY